ncbi:MAG: gluconate 2-dehydrogenase subunit 3 family protein [Bryobacteraceae bacterium]|jgi:hypothetical protein
MKRRRFIKALAAVPAVPALVAQSPPVPTGRGGATAGGRGAQEIAQLPLTEAGAIADPVARFFTAPQFAALRRLGGILVPPVAGNIGALDCDAPEFIDFLISASPAERQQLYRNGLDALNMQARSKFGKPFADLDATQADAILKPLMVTVAWAYDPPRDPVKHFVFQAHQDIRTATRNSIEASSAAAISGRRGFAGAGLYWNPVDPV